MLYCVYMIGFFLAKVLPVRAGYFIAKVVAWGFFVFSKRDKEELKANLRVVLGDDVSEKILDEHVYAVFKNFAKYLSDFFRFPRFTEEYISKNMEIENVEYVDQAREKGKGAVLLALHLGNWELGGAVIGGLGYPISAIILEQKTQRINDFFVKQRAINGLRSIPIGPAIREGFKVLKRNELLAIVGDKDYTEGGISVNFFGKEAIMPKGPAVFSVKTGAPIVFCILIRNKDDSFKMIFENPIYPVSTGNYDEDVMTMMREYLKYFEKYIKMHPDQWYVFRKIWKQN